MGRAEITRSRWPRSVKATINSRPVAVCPSAMCLGSATEWRASGRTTSGRPSSSCSHSAWVTRCRVQFLCELASSHSKLSMPRKGRSDSGRIIVYEINIQIESGLAGVPGGFPLQNHCHRSGRPPATRESGLLVVEFRCRAGPCDIFRKAPAPPILGWPVRGGGIGRESGSGPKLEQPMTAGPQRGDTLMRIAN